MAEGIGTSGPGPAAGIEADVCIAGAGPAGLALGLELARRGRRVAVLERKTGFERSFRGESMSPDAVWLLDRLGVLDALRPAARTIRGLEIRDGGARVFSARFAAHPWESRHPLEIPQPALLSEMAGRAAAYPGFSLLRGHTAAGFLHSGGRVAGVRSSGPDGELVVRSAATVVADGRFSTLRGQTGLDCRTVPLDRDVLWLKLPRPPAWDPDTYAVRGARGSHMVLIPSVPDQIRIGLNIPKGAFKQWRAQGLRVLYDRFDLLAPELSGTVREQVADWSDTALLDIFTTTVPAWSAPGVVLIGDAAHTLSPILGLGVYHALVDAAVLAPLLDRALGADDAGAAVDAATGEFQRLREPAVDASRAAQLRQERAFALTGTAAAALRKSVYRLLDRSGPLKRKLVTRLYYGLQSDVREGRLRLDHAPVGAGETAQAAAALREAAR